MLAVLIGYLLVPLGLIVLILPLVVAELTRPKDSFWGALIVILGLVLVLDNDRFKGSSLLEVCLGTLLFFRLFAEISQYRFQQLTLKEKANLTSFGHWKNGFLESIAAFLKLGSIFSETFQKLGPNKKQISKAKKWTRPDSKNHESLTKQDATNSEQTQKDEKSSAQDKISSQKNVNPTFEDP